MYILHVHVYSQYGIRAVDNCETEGNCSFRSGRTIKESLAAAANVMNSRFIQIWIDVHTVTLFASVNHECGPRLWVDWSSARTPHACLLIPVHNVKSACMAFDGYVCYRRKAVHLNKYVNKGVGVKLHINDFPCYWNKCKIFSAKLIYIYMYTYWQNCYL